MRTSVFLCVYAWLVSYSHVCLAGHTLNAGDRLTENETTLVSVGKIFELGFFSPSFYSTYLGIWYYGLKAKTVVWVANRDKPIIGSKGVFEIAEDGNLKVLSSNEDLNWSSGLNGSSAANRTVMLMDSGNLVLVDNRSGITLWQSFEHPTDTFLPGMKMDTNLQLTSWLAENDPRPGNYTFKQGSAGGNNYIISNNQGQLYWESETTEIPSSVKLLINSTLTINTCIKGNWLINSTLTNFTCSKLNLSRIYNSRLLMDSTGHIQLLERVNSLDSIKWKEPENLCKIYNRCGTFSSCIDIPNMNPCRCIPGFSRRSSQDSGYYTYYPDRGEEGCVRKLEPCGENITFLNLQNVKVRNADLQISELQLSGNETINCESWCRKSCSDCQAFSNMSTDTKRDVPNLSSRCLIWTKNLSTVEQDPEYGLNLFVRVHKLDIELTPRTCEPCGTNIIPYPLSTGANCGDPMYYNFSCDISTGNVFFRANRSNYTVIDIDPTKRKIHLKTEGIYCNPNTSGDANRQTDFSSPFHVVRNACHGEDLFVTWDSPPEPNCSNSTDCQDWDHSTCNASATEIGKCRCNTNYEWNNSTLSCTFQGTLRENSSNRLPLILSVVLILACIIISLYVWKKKLAHKRDREGINRIQGHMFDSVNQVKDLIDLGELEEKDNEGIGVPYFDFKSILEATDNFSDANKLGQGGYGPVYKGKLQGDQEIAVKRLSNISSQGLQEFKNEIVLIAKLQHRNLVRLRGYCIKGEEKILLYEFMSNKSLDKFIFDSTKSVLLNWPMRFDIIMGVARGLLYLHQDSRLRVIHRDLKTSNILLDEEMQPKISDFGLARIFGGKETEANTERVVGTYGYMSPEYALDGFFSTKSDIFSFGVVILEIIGGKKNTRFYLSGQLTSLLGHVWRLWAQNMLLDLMDPSLQETVNTNQFIRCAQLSLLCVQDEPGDRPTMSNVVTMLNTETLGLPNPKQPTFFMNRAFSSTASSSSRPEISLQTDSILREGR